MKILQIAPKLLLQASGITFCLGWALKQLQGGKSVTPKEFKELKSTDEETLNENC
jgi:hypothetical protein